MLISHFLFSCRSLLGLLYKLSSHYTGVQVTQEDTGHPATVLLISISVFLPVLSHKLFFRTTLMGHKQGVQKKWLRALLGKKLLFSSRVVVFFAVLF